jgi:hypothetical protein
MSDWREKAACRGIAHNPDFNPDEDPFYDPPEREDGGDKWEYARALCDACPVRQACLDDALRTEQRGQARDGFRGGHTAGQRRRISLGLPAVPPRRQRKTNKAAGDNREAVTRANAASVSTALRKRQEWVDNIADLLDLGYTGEDIVRKLSRRPDAIYKRLESAGRTDLWARFGISSACRHDNPTPTLKGA